MRMAMALRTVRPTRPAAKVPARTARTPADCGKSIFAQQSKLLAARKKAGRGKKIALGVIIAILVVAVGGGSAFALWKNSVNEKLIKGNKSDEEIMAINDALKPEKDMTFTEPFYMILIGTDEAEDSTEDMHRSDTNIVVRIDPAKNQATMVSIPRDTKIDIDGYGTNKFNAAYAYGGAARNHPRSESAAGHRDIALRGSELRQVEGIGRRSRRRGRRSDRARR